MRACTRCAGVPVGLGFVTQCMPMMCLSAGVAYLVLYPGISRMQANAITVICFLTLQVYFAGRRDGPAGAGDLAADGLGF